MSGVFDPRNDLERQLAAAQEGMISEESFMEALLGSQVFMPVRDQDGIKGFQRSTRAVPLTLQSEEGIEVLILFTSPERARDFLRDFPGYQGGLLAEFTWVLERVGSGVGITLNPGWEVGLDLEPEMVQQLIQSQKGEAEPQA